MKTDDFIDTLILLIDDAEQAGISYDEMLQILREATEDVEGRKAKGEPT